MNDAAFTLGPWKVLSPRLGCFEIAGPNGEDLGFFNCSDGLDEPTEYPARENASLAASAPDLYAALLHCRGPVIAAIKSGNSPLAVASLRILDAALAKARGETP